MRGREGVGEGCGEDGNDILTTLVSRDIAGFRGAITDFEMFDRINPHFGDDGVQVLK